MPSTWDIDKLATGVDHTMRSEDNDHEGHKDDVAQRLSEAVLYIKEGRKRGDTTTSYR